MVRFIAVLLIAFPALADDASKNAKIQELMKLSHADQMMKQMFTNIKSMQESTFGKMDIPAEAREIATQYQTRIFSLIEERMSWDRMSPAFAKVYSETFTEQEIEGMVQFYRSPAGRAMIDKMPVLMQRSMAVGQQLMGEMMPEIQKLTQEMTEKIKKQ